MHGGAREHQCSKQDAILFHDNDPKIVGPLLNLDANSDFAKSSSMHVQSGAWPNLRIAGSDGYAIKNDFPF